MHTSSPTKKKTKKKHQTIEIHKHEQKRTTKKGKRTRTLSSFLPLLPTKPLVIKTKEGLVPSVA